MQDSPNMSSDMPDALPIGSRQVPELPIAPRRPPPMRLIAGISGVVVVAALVTGLVYWHNQSAILSASQVQNVLNKAASAPLHDTAFTLAATIGGSFSGVSASTTITGNGSLTTAPNRLHVALQSPGILGTGAFSTEEIVDGADVYSKSGSGTQLWSKNTGALAAFPGLNFSDLLNYQKLHNPQSIGEDTINGHKAWHFRATLGNLIDGGSVAATATAISQQSNTTTTLTEDLWIREDTYFPAQLTLNTKTTLASNGVGGNLTTDETLTFTQWNTGLVINVPPPSEVQG